MQFSRIACIITLIIASSLLAVAQSALPLSAAETIVALNTCSTAQPLALVRAGNHAWQPAKITTRDGHYIFNLSPAELGGNDILLLINPPAGLDISDVVPPAVTGLKVDGKPYPARPFTHLGIMPKAPHVILVGVADAANKLDTTSIEVTFNGDRLPKEAISVVPAGNNKATVSADLGDVEYGSHRAVISICDASPQRNVLKATVAFDRRSTTNYLNAGAYEVTLKTDSAYAGYESLASLTDGFIDLDGNHCQNDVSWASAEQPDDHWVEVTMDQPRTISEVSLYWAYLNTDYHTSQKILIQVPDGDSWKTVYSSPSGGMKIQKCSTLAFEPVKTQRFRVFQPAGGGSPTRTNLMWLAEIEAR